ncbi:MAG TPA: hypothetical protein VFE61_14205 [Candidatus Sulfotelmatobacter sp.]|nr:hypothetical protein [Candidatus Sulfotelmatobacter sp.]
MDIASAATTGADRSASHAGCPEASTTPAADGTAETNRSHSPTAPVDNGWFQKALEADGGRPQLVEIKTAGVPVPEPPNSGTVRRTLFGWIKESIAAQTRLPGNTCALISFWALSTWFPEAFTVFPCLVLTGPAYEATGVLRALKDLCYAPVLMAAFRSSDLKVVNFNFRTLLISQPNMNDQTAALLGNLTNRDFMMVEQGSYRFSAGSRAIYIGEDPTIKKIQNAIYINVAAPSSAGPPTRPEWVADLADNLYLYRDKYLEQVRRLEFNPSGLSLEAHAIAKALGSCIIDAPELQSELVALLQPHDRQQAADRSDRLEALVAGAALTLCHMGKEQIFVKQIAAEVNRVLEDRGETLRLSPEKVGHRLKRIGLLTRTLSQVGNGLLLDGPTKVRVHEVAAAYRMEGSIADGENLHCPLCHNNE